MKQIRGTVAMLLAVAMVASMAACGTTKPTSAAASGSDATVVSSTPTQEAVPPVQTLAVGDWVIEPTLEAQYITGMGDYINEREMQSVYSHLAICKQENDWQYLNALTGRIFGKVWNIETFGDVLSGWNVNDSTTPYETFEALDDALFAKEGVRMDYGEHGGNGYFDIAVADGKLGLIGIAMEIGIEMESGLCFSAFDNDPEYYGYAQGPAYAALLLDVHNGDWEKETDGMGGEYWWFQGDTTNYAAGAVVADKNGTLLSDTVYEDYLLFHEGVAAMQLNGKWGYVNEQGVAITDFVYEPLMFEEMRNDGLADYDGKVERRHPYSANEGMIPVKKDGLCGVIDIKGKEIIPCKYENIASVYGGRVWAKENGKWGMLNLTKNAELSTEETARITEELHCGKKSANIYDWRYESQLFSEARPPMDAEIEDYAARFPRSYLVSGVIETAALKKTKPNDYYGEDPDTTWDYSDYPSDMRPIMAGKNPTFSTCAHANVLVVDMGEKTIFAQPAYTRLIATDSITNAGHWTYARGNTVYLARGEYENGGFFIVPNGSVPAVIDKNGEVVITQDDYTALQKAIDSNDNAALKSGMESLMETYEVRPVEGTYVLKKSENGYALETIAYALRAQEITPDETQKTEAAAAFRSYYVSYLNAINALDGTLTKDCTESQRARQEERIMRFNKDYTFENQELLMDADSFTLSNENGVLTAHYNIRCNNKCFLRDTKAQQEMNVAIQRVTAEYNEKSGKWRIAASVLQNNIPMGENLTSI